MNNHLSTSSHPPRRGFTIVEILVVIAIIAVLAALSFVVLGRLSRAGSSVTMANNLRQIGTLIPLYAQDHNDQLPGPLHLGQRPIYRSGPPTHLAYHFEEYFGAGEEMEEGEEIPELSSPMWRKKTTTVRGISLLSQQDVDPDPRTTRSPWGYAGAEQDDPNRQPMRMSQLAGYSELPWALVEADREHPLVGGAGWREQMPEKPVHGSYRLALLFDGSVVQRKLQEEFEDER